MNLYAWYRFSSYYTLSATPNVGDSLYNANGEESPLSISYVASDFSYIKDDKQENIYTRKPEDDITDTKYISNLSNGIDTYIIKDAEARTAIANKQDTLVSGTNIKTINNTSILGSGNISISTGDYDNETITKNGDNELQTVAIVNPNINSGAISPLKIWNGSEYQWNHGAPTTWYYWQTSVTAMWTNGGNIGSSDSWEAMAFGDSNFVISSPNSTFLSSDDGSTWSKVLYAGGYVVFGESNFIIVRSGSSIGYYSSDGGATWNSSSLGSSKHWRKPCYGNGVFITIDYSSNIGMRSTDEGVTWTQFELPSTFSPSSRLQPVFANGNFVIFSESYSSAVYSSDGGITWNTATLPSSGSWLVPVSANGNFITVRKNSDEVIYSSDGGATWNTTHLSISSNWNDIQCINNKVVIVNNASAMYSTDGGVTWNTSTFPTSISSFPSVMYGDDIFIVTGNNSTTVYSTDGGATWSISTLPSSGANFRWAFGNNKFITGMYANTATYIFSVTYDKCYTNTANPTTASVVYSAPEIISTKTITSVGSGTITLSNNLVYNSSPSGNQNTYRTLGDAHPNWLCNINNVGVKIGNTTIATAGGTDVVALTDSEIENLWDSNS